MSKMSETTFEEENKVDSNQKSDLMKIRDILIRMLPAVQKQEHVVKQVNVAVLNVNRGMKNAE